MYYTVQMGWDGYAGQCGSVLVPLGISHGIPVYHTVQMGWDGHVGQCGSVVVPMVHPMGITVYHTVQLGWDGHVGQWGSVVVPIIPWDSSVPYGTDGMGRIYRTVWVSGGTHGTSHWIPVHYMVHMGWDGHVGQCESVVVPMVHPMGFQCTIRYRWDGTDM